MSKVLGLENLVAVQALLATARKNRQAIVDDATEEAENIRSLLAGVTEGEDDRIDRARTALKTSAWDLRALEKLVQGSDSGESRKIDILRRLVATEPVDRTGVLTAVENLRTAARALADLAGTDTERSGVRAEMLEQALSWHEKHHGRDCPVCNAPGALSANWAEGRSRRDRSSA